MNRFNRPLTFLTLAVLVVTVSILMWARRRVVQDSENAVAMLDRRLRPFEELFGEPSSAQARITELEPLIEAAEGLPYFRRIVATKILPDSRGRSIEVPIVPYDYRFEHGPNWRDTLEGMERIELREGEDTFGFLYLDLDRSSIVGLNWAIGAASIAMIASLLTLLGRLHFQESSIGRLGGELEQRKRELIRLERLARAGQLSANLLHDLKKPVLNVRHNLEELKEALGDFSGASPPLTDSRAQIDLFFQILNDSQMERFVRSDRVQEEYVDLNEILEMSLKLVRYERGAIDIVRTPGEGLPPVLAQPYQLVQVFSNLILNAYHAMGGEGKLTIETRREGDGVEARITDTGPGVPAEHLSSIFEAFFTTKSESEGSGLGLAICRMIVEGLGGRIDVDSPPGGPATFKVWLPAEAETAARRAERRSA